jgi:RNA polymerase sigma-70 factor (sigma-E family)
MDEERMAVGFDAFVRARQGELARLGWGLTGDRQRGEDLAQAAFDRLWRRWSTVSASGDPWAYTQRIAVTLASSWRRRRWSSEVPTASPASGPAPGEQFDGVLSRHLVEMWLALLPPRQRAVITLRFLLDLSVVETADRMSCSTGTVKSQTSKALTTLRGALAPPTLSPEDAR